MRTICFALLVTGCAPATTSSGDATIGDVTLGDVSIGDATLGSDGTTATVTTTADSVSQDTTTPADSASPDTTMAADAVAPDPNATWFSHAMPWTRPVAGLDPSPESEAIIGDLVDQGGWGNGNVFQIDFSITVLEADEATPTQSFEPTEDWYETECDDEAVPVPPGGALEGEDGYACEGDGDCHLIVRDGASRRLFEMWRANIDGGTFYGGCLAIWDLDHAYDDNGRGQGCTSADAAGLPIAPLLFSAEEVLAGHIDHAIRFILPNARIRHREYVAPATHSTGPTAGGDDAPPYGVRLRLRADYPIDALPSDGARAVAKALQTYGMFLADAGQIALTARDDRFGTASWAGLLGPRDLSALKVDDFEVVELGPTRYWDGDCVRE